jgi:Cell division protein
MQKVLFSLIIGFLLGLVVAACVSFYINSAQLPFVDRFSEREGVEAPANWNPNASLQQGSTATISNAPPPLQSNTNTTTGNLTPDNNPPAVAVGGGYDTGLPIPANPSETTQPATNAQFYVQAGAFSTRQEAEQQRARLALVGTQATISQVSISGQTFHRVRVGPYNTRTEAQNTIQRLANDGIQSTIAGS